MEVAMFHRANYLRTVLTVLLAGFLFLCAQMALAEPRFGGFKSPMATRANLGKCVTQTSTAEVATEAEDKESSERFCQVCDSAAKKNVKRKGSRLDLRLW